MLRLRNNDPCYAYLSQAACGGGGGDGGGGEGEGGVGGCGGGLWPWFGIEACVFVGRVV